MARTIKTRSQPARGREGAAGLDLGELPQLAGYMLRRAQVAVFQDFLRAFAEIDIRPAQYAALVVIERNPGLKQSQLSAALGIKRANLVALLDSLERRGLAKRAAAQTDRRSHALFLTEKGEALMPKLRDIIRAHERRVSSKLSEDERRQLLNLLRSVRAAAASSAEDVD